LAPAWSPGYHTLARAQINFGELELGAINLKKSLQLTPDNKEVKEDLKWVATLLKQKAKFEKSKGVTVVRGVIQVETCEDACVGIGGIIQDIREAEVPSILGDITKK